MTSPRQCVSESRLLLIDGGVNMFSLFGRKLSLKKTRRGELTKYRPRLDVLEDRTLLSGFVDGFEGPTLNPWWNGRVENSGHLTFPSTAHFHGGTQSLELDSTYNTGQKDIRLQHFFDGPVFGRFSVWMYDTGAGIDSS